MLSKQLHFTEFLYAGEVELFCFPIFSGLLPLFSFAARRGGRRGAKQGEEDGGSRGVGSPGDP